MEAEGKEDACCPACKLAATHMPQQTCDSTDASNGPLSSVMPGSKHYAGFSSKLVVLKKVVQDPKRIKPDEKVKQFYTKS